MPDVASTHARLLVNLHERGSQEIDLTHDRFTIGRKPDNDLVIDDPAVSGHHARLLKIQSVYFVEDANSTNGTAVNGTRVERHQLRDADVVTIGLHRLIFRDGGAAAPLVPTEPAASADETMVLTAAVGRRSAPAAPVGRIVVVQGKTDRRDYHLTKHINVIGSQADAAVRLTGWFAPKNVAMIARRGSGYSVNTTRTAKTLLVNGTEVKGQQDLQHGDLIEVARIKMYFYLNNGR